MLDYRQICAFFTKTYAHLFQLEREYAHKAALAGSVHGFKLQAKKYEEEITAEVFMEIRMNPASVTSALIRKVLRKYLLILRSTSIMGMEDTISIFERMQIWWIYFADLRERNRILRSILGMSNEWAKVLSAVAGAFLVGYFTGSK